jgi:hypothetical protein
VPDELKKHSLSDGVGGQYSTNLDRNRYGADDQYLSTVIRYDLEYLRLCPCLVDVEIIDAKNGSGTILVSAGPEYCLCNRDAAQVPAKTMLCIPLLPMSCCWLTFSRSKCGADRGQRVDCRALPDAEVAMLAVFR